MDKAILSHVKDLSLEYLKDNYTKVDEIPFDFTRRRMSVVVEDRQGKLSKPKYYPNLTFYCIEYQ